ncbi:MAG: quinolinate synthase NadA [Thermodesulfobacteriota bacterium]|nr:quinolinate synthase NadA [Thermodesulfobacteriota bacterium]
MTQASETITSIRRLQGPNLAILGHHYQSDQVIRHVDLTGDSLELSRQVMGLDAKYIVFCGVYFMAESAAILAKPGQKVFIPDESAGCTMSNMAPAWLVERVIQKLTARGRRLIPLAYVNSSAEVKAICGKWGGSVCTSANAETMLKWALGQGQGVLFLPDRNLAMNTADRLNIPEPKRLMLDVRSKGQNLDPASADEAELLIWPGLCVTHHRFKELQVSEIRKQEPNALIVVHPESPPPVVKASDAAGSTSFIIKYVREARPGAKIYIGTEINLVKRLGDEYQGKKTVRPLFVSSCLNMAKITEENLAHTLENLESAPPVKVAEEITAQARIALERMLEACAEE